MATVATLGVDIKALGITGLKRDLSAVQGGLEKTDRAADQAGRQLERTGRRGGRAVGGLKMALGGIAGIVGFGAITGGLASMVGEFQESRKVGAQTTAVLKSTGGAANVTSKQVNNLANALSKKAGVDDETVQSGENLLLTFTKVRNETGRGNDVFNQATKTMLDMSAALGQDTRTSALQLGKALQDPVRGVTALRRVGVELTNEQQDQIKALVASGRSMDAQKIILRELNTEFGGSAAAQRTALDSVKVAMSNVAEAAGSVLVPAFDAVAKVIVTFVDQATRGVSVGGAFVTVFRTTGSVVADTVGAFIAIVTWLKNTQAVLYPLAGAVGAVTAAWAAMTILTTVQSMLAATRAAVIAMNVALLANPILLVVAALGVLVGALIYAYKTSDTFRAIVDGAWSTVKAVVIGAAVAIAKAVTGTWNTISSVTSATWGFVSKATTDAWNAIKTAVLTPIRVARDVLAGDVFPAISNAASATWGAILKAAGSAWNAIKTAITTPITAARDLVSGVWHEMGVRADSAWSSLIKAIGGFAEGVKNAVTDAFKGAANAVIKFVNVIIGAVNLIPGVPDIKKIPELATGGQTGGNGTRGPQGLPGPGQALAEGGKVTRPLAIVGEEAPRHPEYVIPTNPAYRGRAVGLFGMLGKELGVPGFARGGVLGFNDLKSLWEGAGGPGGNISDTAAAIALAESGGNVGIVNGIGAAGLWQIYGLPFPGNPLDAATNARMAVAKFRGAGGSFTPWTTYTGADTPGHERTYLRYMPGHSGGVLGAVGGAIGSAVGAVGGIMGDLLSQGAGFILDKLPGVGDLPDWVQGMGHYALDKVTGWIKDKVSDVVGNFTGGGGGGGGQPGGGGTTMFDGKPVASWIVPILSWARGHGWHGSVTSGYRDPQQQMAAARGYGLEHYGPAGPLGSNHVRTAYPGGAVDVSDPPGLARVLSGYQATNGRTLVWGNPVIGDFVHFSATGHRTGGIIGGPEGAAPYVGSYRNGGTIPRDGYAFVHAGERVDNGRSGFQFQVQGDLVIQDRFDLEMELARMAFRAGLT
jgi:hypothetical protein